MDDDSLLVSIILFYNCIRTIIYYSEYLEL